jgi:dTDP-4-dehydrorhamnose reductase
MKSSAFKTVLLFGKDGMLGSNVYEKLKNDTEIELIATSRRPKSKFYFDIRTSDLDKTLSQHRPDYVINCLGVIDPKIQGLSNTLKVNSFFPSKLAKSISKRNIFLIQFSSDGVFFGSRGGYSEQSIRIPRSVYSISKILGEKDFGNTLIIRSSIIGQNPQNNSMSIINWFLNLPKNSTIYGYTNKYWNGITSNVISNLCKSIIMNSYKPEMVQHFIPRDSVSKYQLLMDLRDVFDRTDIVVRPEKIGFKTDRRLETNQVETNKLFWKLAGFEEIPTVKQMLSSLSNDL